MDFPSSDQEPSNFQYATPIQSEKYKNPLTTREPSFGKTRSPEKHQELPNKLLRDKPSSYDRYETTVTPTTMPSIYKLSRTTTTESALHSAGNMTDRSKERSSFFPESSDTKKMHPPPLSPIQDRMSLKLNYNGPLVREPKAVSDFQLETKKFDAIPDYKFDSYDPKPLFPVQKKEVQNVNALKNKNYEEKVDNKDVPNLYYCCAIEDDTDSERQSDEEFHQIMPNLLEKRDYKPQHVNKLSGFENDPNWGMKGTPKREINVKNTERSASEVTSLRGKNS